MRCTNIKFLYKVLFGVSTHLVTSFSSFFFAFDPRLIIIIIDQMGVELGKVLAKNILAQLDKPADVTGHDSSVRHLIVFFFFLFWLIDVLSLFYLY